MQRTNIYLDEGQARALDRLAAHQGTSRSELIRELLDHALAGDADLEADLAAIDASFASLGETTIGGRSDGDRAAHLGRMWTLRATG